jgi:hypothetical protein
VLVRREEGLRQRHGPSKPAVQRRAGRQLHNARDLDDGGDEDEDGGREKVFPVEVDFVLIGRELPQANIVDLPGSPVELFQYCLSFLCRVSLTIFKMGHVGAHAFHNQFHLRTFTVFTCMEEETRATI